ncbi:hypothetical protein TSAR_002100, partial [Trichomalopsis sarcophagae]
MFLKGIELLVKQLTEIEERAGSSPAETASDQKSKEKPKITSDVIITRSPFIEAVASTPNPRKKPKKLFSLLDMNINMNSQTSKRADQLEEGEIDEPDSSASNSPPPDNFTPWDEQTFGRYQMRESRPGLGVINGRECCIPTSEEDKENSLINFSEQLKSEIGSRDTHASRNYKLNSNMRFEMFEDYMKSELRIKKLIYILENEALCLFSEQKVKEDKFKVRDIIINRIDVSYNKIMNLNEPKEILEKLKNVKRYELKTTRITARNDLNLLKYQPGKESASDFYDKFQEKVRIFENLPDSEKISEKEKIDYFIQAVSEAVPGIVTVDSIYLETTIKEMPCDQLMNHLLKVEAVKIGKEPKAPTRIFYAESKQSGQGRRICHGCGMEGYFQSACPHLGRKQCYNCLKIGSHLAKDCRKRKSDNGAGDLVVQAPEAKKSKWMSKRGGAIVNHRGRGNQPARAGQGRGNRGQGRGSTGQGGQNRSLGKGGLQPPISLQAIAENYE